ncbi:SGNH hydrolase-type esterase domain-containing protein [Ephemerocybe angulata]|uniref:SGNH hydrolase-type esterase domain-containing protein n=1 Tax=Ephemerocybe angulata TaxID=980116 RepID=A0A8H6M444_9AGAR|nr:SGNH hydrolase-type esterase domain-containing protein [Tulosesus angulatus]
MRRSGDGDLTFYGIEKHHSLSFQASAPTVLTITISLPATQTAAHTNTISSNTITTTTTAAETATATPAKAITVLPLGDSITFGLGTADRNSYRQFLQQRLKDDAIGIDYIGSVRSGTLTDNENEGHSGAVIDQIRAFGERTIAASAQKPEVVTLLAGTNDVARKLDLANAPARVLSLVDRIHALLPHATVLVGSIPPLPFIDRQNVGVGHFNDVLQNLVQARIAANGNGTANKVGWVSMEEIGVEDLADGVHPNAGGYVKMGRAWASAMEDAIGKGLVIV